MRGHDTQKCGIAGADWNDSDNGLLVWDFVFNVLNVLRGLIPATMLFSSFIYAFACFSIAVFFYVFHKAKT